MQRLLVLAFLLLGSAPALAQSQVMVNYQGSTTTNLPTQVSAAHPMPVLIGGSSGNNLGNVGTPTAEVCVTPTVTASSAYSAGNEVGGLITMPNAFLAGHTGTLQSVRLIFKDSQTAEFDVSQFSDNPSNTTWTDKTTPSINAADVFKVHPIIRLTNSNSALGTMTSYGYDGIGRAHQSTGTSDWFVITTTGTPTFGSTSDVQFCATYYQNP